MYIPKPHEETRIPVLQDFMEAHAFATLVTMGSSGLFATHLPLVFDRGLGALGTLKGHISRANSQWREFSPDIEALVIFSGPEHYITPNWYAEKQRTGKVVPTWNYAAVHAYGQLKVVEDANWLLDQIKALTTVHESSQPAPWKVSDAPESFVQSSIKGIVGIEIVVSRLEGKWKISQNRSREDRLGIAEGLGKLNTPPSLEMKLLIEEGLADDEFS